MAKGGGKVVIIGAGIAGLCAAVYARKCGYEVEVLEQHGAAGGLATSWRRGDYTFETCLHWLLGSNPSRSMYPQWEEVFDIGQLTFVQAEEYLRLEAEGHESLSIYSNVDRMEAEFLARAPEDAEEIRHLAAAIRKLGKFQMPDPSASWPAKGATALRMVPYLPLLRRWSGMSLGDYGRRFKHPLLRAFFANAATPELSAVALVFALAWMSERDAGYPIGGSQAVIRPIVDNLQRLGGHLRLGARVERILVEQDSACGVQLAGGETVAADWVISAADGHATLYDLLAGRYTNKAIDSIYRTWKTFPSYLQVSLGVARDLSAQPGFVTRLLDTPLRVDPGTELREISFRVFHFDPTFAPPGKTAVSCFLPTFNHAYWVGLQQQDPARYQAEKNRVAEGVIALLEQDVPDVRPAIEVIDVATPATVIRYTGNWQGSMEGWLLTPGTGFRPLRRTLPGLRRFLMVGQWVMPGGGLPSGLMTARSAVRWICRQDRVPFSVGPGHTGETARTH
ncbi:NAD(P)/FAD-dependent oxidoreductase [Ectothiorhodospiraceae bacterium 2226]|nr:NAD(P)/FAD-dependent oxidoreductase [Ectothiorhodospiraceae bacterium 2226]